MDFEAVIVGGGVARLGDRLLGPLTLVLRAELADPAHTVAVLPSPLGRHGPPIGAGLMAFEAAAGRQGDGARIR